jgi:hypothetical protein
MKGFIAAVFVALAAGGAWLAFAGTDECRAQGAGGDVEPRAACSGGASLGLCRSDAGFVRGAVVPTGRRVRLRFTRRARRPVTVEVFQASIGRRILGNRRIARFNKRSRSFTWNGKRARDGYLFVRFRSGADVRRSVLRRRDGRVKQQPAFYRRSSCLTLALFKLERPVFGGRTNRALKLAYRVSTRARVGVVVLRGRKVVRRFRARAERPGETVRRRLASEKLRRGRYRVQVTVRPERGVTTRATLTAQRL